MHARGGIFFIFPCEIVSGPQNEEDHQDRYHHSVQQPGFVMVGACTSVLGEAHFRFCDGSINVGKYTDILD